MYNMDSNSLISGSALIICNNNNGSIHSYEKRNSENDIEYDCVNIVHCDVKIIGTFRIIRLRENNENKRF